MRLTEDDYAELDVRLAGHDAFLRSRYPGERPGRQPVHTVYIPADKLDNFREWGAIASAAMVDFPWPAEDVRAKLAREPISLDAPVSRDADADLGDFLEDADAVLPANAAAAALFREQLDAMLRTLPDRDMRIVRLRYGLVDGRARTLEEVGREFGLTRERIRQIESKTLARLRQSPAAAGLRDFAD